MTPELSTKPFTLSGPEVRAVLDGMAEFEGAKPWPEWAKQALAAGWRAPKGWTP